MADNEITLADFDLDEWIDGTSGITGVARLVQRGDLLAKRDRLEAELSALRRVPPGDLGVADRTPEQVEAELEQCYEEIWSSMLWVHIQDRTEARRQSIRDRLKKEGVASEDRGLYVIADSIVKVETADGRIVPLPEDGFPVEKLRKIRDRLGDAGLVDVVRVFQQVTSQSPSVRAPLSHEPSSTRGGTTSPSRSGRRPAGGRRRS